MFFTTLYAATETPISDVLAPYLNALYTHILNPLIAFLFAVALAVFFYGLVRFILNTGNGKENADGKQHMIWGIVGLCIMISVYGILNVVCNTIGCSG
jgi:cbb3-type cytochrome oxidase subunit 3